MRDETKCLHAGYIPKKGEPRVLPIVQSTTYVYDKAEEVGEIFDDPTKGLVYSRFANPTVMAVEAKVAELEGGAAAMATSSGQAAAQFAVMTLCEAGDSFISTNNIYGGTTNLFANTLRKFGIECILIDGDSSEEEILAAFKPNTKLVFAESLSNPSMAVLDIEKFARAAHSKNVPLVVDNTVATPILCKPIEHGADIIVHSTSKYMDGHALQVGGMIVDSGKFDWKSGNFPGLTESDPTYRGITYTETYGNLAYIIKSRMQLMRDFGAYPSAHSAFLLNIGLETLPLRMERVCENSLKIAEYLESSAKVSEVCYPFLKSSKYYKLAQKYLKGGSGIIALTLKGGKPDALKFINSLKLTSNQIHLADIRTCVLNPATTTHRQLTDEQLAAAGINPGMVRLSVGIEHIDDILNDIEAAMRQLG